MSGTDDYLALWNAPQSAAPQFSLGGPSMAPASGVWNGSLFGGMSGGMGSTSPFGTGTSFNFGQPAAQSGGIGSWLSNGNNIAAAAQGIGALTNAWLGYKQLQQAKQQFGLQKEAFNANLNNSIKSYNTSLEDRINGRTSAYAGKEQDVAAYLARHSLKR